MERASSLLGPLVDRLGIAEGVLLARLRSDWRGIFDEPLSLHMWPSKYSGGTLLLNVDSPLWVHQLSYHKSAILKKLAVYGIRDIRFRAGKISNRKQPVPDGRALRGLSEDDIAFISGLVSGIDDEALREAIQAAVSRSLKEGTGNKKRTGG